MAQPKINPDSDPEVRKVVESEDEEKGVGALEGDRGVRTESNNTGGTGTGNTGNIINNYFTTINQPGNPITAIQYNIGNAFGGDANFTYANGTMTIVQTDVGSGTLLNTPAIKVVSFTGTQADTDTGSYFQSRGNVGAPTDSAAADRIRQDTYYAYQNGNYIYTGDASFRVVTPPNIVDANMTAAAGRYNFTFGSDPQEVGNATNLIYNRVEWLTFGQSATFTSSTVTTLPGHVNTYDFTGGNVTGSIGLNQYKARGKSPNELNPATGVTTINANNTIPLQIGDAAGGIYVVSYSGNGTRTDQYGLAGYVGHELIKSQITAVPTTPNGQFSTTVYIRTGNAVSNTQPTMTFDSAGNLTIPTQGFFTGNAVVTNSTPASASATGVTGQIVYDSDYVYICVATNTWKRAALSTW